MSSPDPEPDAVRMQTTTEGITTITISRPRKRNAVDTRTALKLLSAFQAFDGDATQKVCVFHGAGGTFCAGFDLATVPAPSAASQPSNAVFGGAAPMGPSRLQLSKPVIAAVAGFAVAGGLELALLADLRVAEEDAVFGVFCRRWGVPLVDGGTVRLQRVVGLGRALDLILTGRPVDAQEALAMGLANRVVPKGKAVDEAMSLARSLLQFPQRCMNVDRASCYYAAYEANSLTDALKYEYEHGLDIVQAEGAKGAERFRSGAGRHGAFGGSGKLDKL